MRISVESTLSWHIDHHRCLSLTEYGETTISNAKHLAWKFLENPDGPAIFSLAWNGDRLIGRVGIWPRTVVLPNGGTGKIGILIDLLVCKDFRCPDLLIRLVTSILEQNICQFDALITTPNASAIGIWKSIGDFSVLHHLSACAIPVLPIPSWASISSNNNQPIDAAPHHSSQSYPPEQITGIVSRSFSSRFIQSRKTTAWLNWRHHQCPGRRYNVRTLLSEDGEHLTSITRTITVHGLKLSMVMDCLALSNLGLRRFQSYAGTLLANASADGCVGLFALGSPDSTTSPPLLPVPGFLLPQEAVLLGRSLTGLIPASSLRSIHINMSDLDMF